MELVSIYYIAMFIVNVIFKLKNHSSRPTKSGFELDIKIKFKMSK